MKLGYGARIKEVGRGLKRLGRNKRSRERGGE